MTGSRRSLSSVVFAACFLAAALTASPVALASNQAGIDLGYPPHWHGAVEIGPPADENAWWPHMWVNAYSGNLFLTFPCVHYESMYGLDLDFVLSFNSKPPQITSGWLNGGNLPSGWTHNYYVYLRWDKTNDKVKIRMGDGKVVEYDEDPGPTGPVFTAEEGWYGRLSYGSGNDEFTLTMPDQVKYVFESYSGPLGNYSYYRLRKLADPTSGWDKWVTVSWYGNTSTSYITKVEEASTNGKIEFSYTDKTYGGYTYKALTKVELKQGTTQATDVRLEYPDPQEQGTLFELTGVRNKEEEDKQEYSDPDFLTQFTYSSKGSRRVPTEIVDGTPLHPGEQQEDRGNKTTLDYDSNQKVTLWYDEEMGSSNDCNFIYAPGSTKYRNAAWTSGDLENVIIYEFTIDELTKVKRPYDGSSMSETPISYYGTDHEVEYIRSPRGSSYYTKFSNYTAWGEPEQVDVKGSEYSWPGGMQQALTYTWKIDYDDDSQESDYNLIESIELPKYSGAQNYYKIHVEYDTHTPTVPTKIYRYDYDESSQEDVKVGHQLDWTDDLGNDPPGKLKGISTDLGASPSYNVVSCTYYSTSHGTDSLKGRLETVKRGVGATGVDPAQLDFGTYDSFGRATQIGKATTCEEGEYGGHITTSYTYDTLWRLTGVEDEVSSYVYTYDGGMHLVEYLYGNDYKWHYDYYADNRLDKIHDPLDRSDWNQGHHIAFTYTVDGLLYEVKHYRSTVGGGYMTWEYEYWPNKKVKYEIKPLDANQANWWVRVFYGYYSAGNETIGYDKGGNLTKRMTAQMYADYKADSQDNDYISYTWDYFNRLSKIDYPNDTDVTFEYDKHDQITEMTDAIGTTTLTWDKMDRLATILDPIESSNRTQAFEYEQDTQYLSRGYVSNRAFDLEYAYYTGTPLLKIVDHNGSPDVDFVGYKYDTAWRATYRYQGPNLSSGPLSNNYTEYRYDVDDLTNPQGWLSRIRTCVNTGGTPGSALEQDQWDLEYVDSLFPAPEKIYHERDREDVDMMEFTYDDLYRLEVEEKKEYDGQAGDMIWKHTYEYDFIGNRTGMGYYESSDQTPDDTYVYEYDKNNRLTMVKKNYGEEDQRVVEYWYDADGNRTWKRVDNTDNTYYDYNDAGKLVKITYVYDNSEVEEFVYSGLGFLRKHRPKSPTGNPDEWIRFTYWGSIYDENLNPDEEIFFYSGFGVIADEDTVEMFHDLASGTDVTYRMFHDYVASTRQIVTDAPNPATDSRFDYTAFGTNDSDEDYSSLNFNAKSPYKYCGNWGYYDGSGRAADTTADGLVRCGHRWYDPEIGRWLTEDPIGFADGWNRYAYCGSNPVTFVDPLGLERQGAPCNGVIYNDSTTPVVFVGEDTSDEEEGGGEKTLQPGHRTGLTSADADFLYVPDGTTIIDHGNEWPTHPTEWFGGEYHGPGEMYKITAQDIYLVNIGDSDVIHMIRKPRKGKTAKEKIEIWGRGLFEGWQKAE